MKYTLAVFKILLLLWGVSKTLHLSFSSEPPKEEWELLCCTAEEWEELTESFHGSKQSYERSLYKALNDELLPDVLQAIAAKVSMCVCVYTSCIALSTYI